MSMGMGSIRNRIELLGEYIQKNKKIISKRLPFRGFLSFTEKEGCLFSSICEESK